MRCRLSRGVLCPTARPGTLPGRKFTVPLGHGQPAGVLTGRLFAHIQSGAWRAPTSSFPSSATPATGWTWASSIRVSSRFRWRRAVVGAQSSGSHGKASSAPTVGTDRWMQKKTPEPVDPYAGQLSGWDEDNDSSADTTALKPTTARGGGGGGGGGGGRSQAGARLATPAPAAAAADAPAPRRRNQVTFAGDADLEA